MQSLPVILVGFLLGMLHATDADHVVAVSTIVSRERSVRGAARIGLLWGLGHTLTVFGVGAAIILFNLFLLPAARCKLSRGASSPSTHDRGCTDRLRRIGTGA